MPIHPGVANESRFRDRVAALRKSVAFRVTLGPRVIPLAPGLPKAARHGSDRLPVRNRGNDSAGLAVLVGAEREDEIKTAIVDGLAPFRTTDGSYLLDNEYRYLVARA